MSGMYLGENESERLNHVAEWFSGYDGFDRLLTDYGFRSVQPYFQGKTCLELGPADGVMTKRLLECFERVTCVEGSQAFCDDLKDRFGDDPKFSVICSLFEEFETSESFDTMIAAHVMEHVADPVAIMKRALDWVKPGGRFIVEVPNANSFHRLLGVKLGMLEHPAELNERDHRLGHRRVYDADWLRRDVDAAGWQCETIVGSYFKVFSNEQSEKWFSPELVHAFWELGKDFPKNGATISAICRKP